ncbi:MAG TPA: Rieske 2Fe-2S domain-containing protein [Gemmatimonadales bacterium]
MAARSEALGPAPLARTVHGRPVVLFRGADGTPSALEDRCPHKNVALSLGRVRAGTLECRYHGWRFDGAGALVDVPCHSPDERLPRCRVPAWRVVERDGWIWIKRAEVVGGADAPPGYERDPRYFWFELEYVLETPVDLILENGLDCSHTGFAHEGLFRSAPTQFVTTRIEVTPTGVRSTVEGERAADTHDTRSRLGRGRTLRHVDEIVAPHTLLVDYAIGRHRLLTILVCTPETPQRTRVFNRNGVFYGPWTPVVGRYVRAVARKVVRQDAEILNSQAARIRETGRREFRHVVADQPAVWMQRVLAGRSGGSASREIVYKL